MKATGIVRRIDDLGRVVIPKEIRRTLRIREGDPLEIFTERDGEIILKKYSPLGDIGQFAGQYAESMARSTGGLVCVTDREHVIAAAGSGKNDYEGKQISKELSQGIENRAHCVRNRPIEELLAVTQEGMGDFVSQAFSTIIAEGDAIGSVILYSREKKMGDPEEMLVQTAAGFLGRHLEQ